MAQQACRQKWLNTPAFSRVAAKTIAQGASPGLKWLSTRAFSRVAAKDNSPGRKPWVGIDKRKALKGRKKLDATFR